MTLSTQIDPDSLRAGDVVLIRVNSFLYRRVAAASMSWTSHVGFLHHRDESGQWIVAESAIPSVRHTTLDKFIARSEKGMFAIRRLKSGVTDEQADKLRAAADAHLGEYYGLRFNYDSSRQFCSKFVHVVFREALGVEVGTVETFRELLDRNPESPLTFWRLWFFGFIPWQQRTVSPASQYLDDSLETIAEKIEL